MDWQARVFKIRDEATALNLNLYKLCVRAGVPYSTVQRWLIGTTSPRMENFEAICSRLELELAKVRAELFAKIVGQVA
jgi:transcriptional regulator with XRE-family HTH domain